MITFNFVNSLWFCSWKREEENMKENNKRRLSWDDGGNVSSTHRFESVWKRFVWNEILTVVTSLKKRRRIYVNSIWSAQVLFLHQCDFLTLRRSSSYRVYMLLRLQVSSIFCVLCCTHEKCETVRTFLSANAKRKEESSSAHKTQIKWDHGI